jgi:predicted dehydrogenase
VIASTPHVWRWGIAGPGKIARGFVDDMRLVAGGSIIAVASRAPERADAFGDEFGIPRRYGAYHALAEDPDVDVVYVATPNSRHASDTLLYIEAGKHVLCEKPFALNAGQAQRMADAARSAGVFLMEAMWSRFLPTYRALATVLGEGRIGDPLMVEAGLGIRRDVVSTHRRFDLALGGGALLDLGVYPVQLCSLVLGLPERVVADGVVGTTGVDESVAAVLYHPGGRLGVVKAAIRVALSCTARITGPDGTIDLPAFMHCPGALTISDRNGVEAIEASWEGEGLHFQVHEVHRCLDAGLTESSIMPLDESVGIARSLDEIRAQLGVVYPGESKVTEMPS